MRVCIHIYIYARVYIRMYIYIYMSVKILLMCRNLKNAKAYVLM